MIGQVNALETAVNSIQALLHADHLGHGGLINEHNELMGRRKYREQSREYHWQFWTAVFVAVIGMTGVVLSNWPTLSVFWKKEMREQGKIEQRIEQGRHPHTPRYRAHSKPKPSEEIHDDPAKEILSQ